MTIIVKEGDHLKLTCAATGNPKPQISWNLKNGHAIPDGAWKSEIITFWRATVIIHDIYFCREQCSWIHFEHYADQ